MKLLRKILKWFMYFLIIPMSYIIISLVLGYITVNRTELSADNNKEVYLSTNGVHLYIIFPVNDLSIALKKDLAFTHDDKYLSFGWGDENFYLKTPVWGDLTFWNAFKALFLKGSALIHLTRYKVIGKSWIKINLSESELKKLNKFISGSFKKDASGNKIIIANSGYSINDDFYKANGHYSIFRTCNTWVNEAFKKSGLKSCLWTPFDFGLIDKYK